MKSPIYLLAVLLLGTTLASLHGMPAATDTARSPQSPLNGLGLAQRVETLNEGNVWNAVSVQYDAMGRLWKRSQPYQYGQPFQPPTLWTINSYDSLGRVTTVQTPDGSQTGFYYNEPNRPSSASKTQGQTLRVVPPHGGDRWYRTNALGQLAEVVEPPLFPRGSPGSDTTYSYNALGLLVRVLQGPDHQERRFLYDLLGRLTAESLPEKTVSPGPGWTDTFTYDGHSNLTSRTDARGVTTIYDYAGDPLDRLQQVSYQFAGQPDSANPVLPSPSVMFKYMATGDVTRVFQISMANANEPWALQEYGYDTEGRLVSKQLSFVGFPAFETDYKYNILNQLTEVIYPVEFGIAAQPRKKLDYSYGLGGSLTSSAAGVAI